MKKILSLSLAALMMVSMIPTAYATNSYDQDYTGDMGTDVSVTGIQETEYTITVPASLVAGGAAGEVKAEGFWSSSETLIVTAADEVEVTNTETNATAMAPVTFAGIEQVGADEAAEAISVSAEISLGRGDIRYGEWTGTIVYNVELDDGLAPFVGVYGALYARSTNNGNQNDSYDTWLQFNEDGTVYLYTHNTTGDPSTMSGFTYDGENVYWSYASNPNTPYYTVSSDGKTVTLTGNGTIFNLIG